jgi:addiction module HigA family antidote
VENKILAGKMKKHTNSTRIAARCREVAERFGASADSRLPTRRPPVHPGEMLLEEFLKPLEISQSECAARLGVSLTRLNKIIHAKCGVTANTALRLERLLGMSAGFWMELQLDWNLWHAMRSRNAEKIARIQPYIETI